MANEPNARGPMLVLVAGSLLVAGLIAWALTRQVEPAPLETTTTTSLASPQLTPQPALTPPLTASTPPVSTQTVTADEAATVSRIAPEELKSLVDRGAVTVIDVRDAQHFNVEHIPGSLHIPMAQVEGEIASIPKGKRIVTYCT